MRVAHIRERHGPAGAPWRLAAMAATMADQAAERWIDLEVARRRLVRADPRLAHNDPLFRRPVTTLDDHLKAGLRVSDLRALVEPLAAVETDADDDALVDAA